MASLIDQFKAMEVDAYSQMLSAEHCTNDEKSTRENVIHCQEKVEIIYGKRKTISQLDYRIVSAITEKINKASSDRRGLILWLNPHVSRDIKPEPIHLRPTIRFLRQNSEIDQSGADVYDLFDEPVDDQFTKIMLWMQVPSSISLDQSKEMRSIDVHETLNRLEAMCLTSPVDQSLNLTQSLEEQMKEITSTAARIFEDIVSEKIRAPDCSGERSQIPFVCMLLFT